MTAVRENNYKILNLCPECEGNIITIQEKGETVCDQCGLIIKERDFDISHKETRAYNKEQKDKKERTGTPISPLLPDLGLCTVIYDKNIYNPDLKRAVKLDSYLSWEKKNMLIALTELRRLSHNLNLPEYVTKFALNLYKEAYRTNILKGRSIIGMVAACVYYTCKIKKIPRPLKDILDQTPVNQKKLTRFYNILVRTLNLKVPINNPIALISCFIAKLGLNFEVEKLTINILETYLKNKSLNGVNPKGICAGAIYMASKFKNIKRSQKKVADIVGVTDVTLRKRYKEILNKINLNVLKGMEG